MNGVRLPTADEDKRAVELDQFPSAVIESIQVSKTFTPDQQGDASGGAVDVRLKGVPDEPFFKFKRSSSHNSSHRRDGLPDLRRRRRRLLRPRRRAATCRLESRLQTGTARSACRRGGADRLQVVAARRRRQASSSATACASAASLSLFYERDSSFYDDGVDDSWWVDNARRPMTPETTRARRPTATSRPRCSTSRRAAARCAGARSATFGDRVRRPRGVAHLPAHAVAEDTATLAEDTRGKQYFFPGYDPDDPTTPGQRARTSTRPRTCALETLEYTERTTETLQLRAPPLPVEASNSASAASRPPELDWTLAKSTADVDQPDKRSSARCGCPRASIPARRRSSRRSPRRTLVAVQAGRELHARQPAAHLDIDRRGERPVLGSTSSCRSRLGRARRRLLQVRRVRDASSALRPGHVQQLRRQRRLLPGAWDAWSVRCSRSRTTRSPNRRSTSTIAAGRTSPRGYGMLDLPLHELAVQPDRWRALRVDQDQRSSTSPRADAFWFPPGDGDPTQLIAQATPTSTSARDDVLPSLGLVAKPLERVTLRAAYSRDVARQTFKELTPIMQQEYLGGPMFIGNPDLEMSELDNYDLRSTTRRTRAGCLAVVVPQGHRGSDRVRAALAALRLHDGGQLPRRRAEGFELEARQDLGHFSGSALDGLSVGANATFITRR
jgi:outer membrane receptor protein involved in Fe transport